MINNEFKRLRKIVTYETRKSKNSKMKKIKMIHP